jgi:glycosyltransferase involved in cell wall biosynthesis
MERGTWRPLVSVVVPTRDRAQLLHRALVSILSQEYDGEIECLTVFDRTEPVLPLLDLATSRTVRAMVNDRTPGPAGARNAGALAARGEILAFCDDDDEWLPNKLRLQVDRLSSDHRPVAVSCGLYVSYENSQAKRLSRRHLVTASDLVRSRVMELNMSTLLLRREDFLTAIGLFDEAIPGSYAEDYEWLLRAAQHGPMAIVPDPLVHIHWNREPLAPERWRTIVAALRYLLRKHPELEQDRTGRSRIYGQIAFAHAALGEREEARRWAARSLTHSLLQPRAYLALLTSIGIARPATVIHLANRLGRGLI